MKVVAISDMHGMLPSPEMFPEAEVLCICGDTFPLRMQKNVGQCSKWFRKEFAEWVDKLPVKHVVMIAGNHDFACQFFDTGRSMGMTESDPTDFRNSIPKVHYLFDKKIEIDGVVFYGTPWCPELYNWAYYATPVKLAAIFSFIPKGVDVLLTHCPPKIGTQGTVLQRCWNFGSNYGCSELADRIKVVGDIQWVLSGHIHTGNHNVEVVGETSCINVSYLNEDYEPAFKPFEFEVEPRKEL